MTESKNRKRGLLGVFVILDAHKQLIYKTLMVEAAGIEPASENSSVEIYYARSQPFILVLYGSG